MFTLGGVHISGVFTMRVFTVLERVRIHITGGKMGYYQMFYYFIMTLLLVTEVIVSG